MNLRRYKPSDYQELCTWWEKHNHPIMSSEILPEGIVVEQDSKAICIGFIYLVNNAEVAQLAWTTSNPEISLRKRYDAVNMLLDGSISYIASLGIKHIMCFTDKNSIAKLLNRRGMRLGNDHILCIGSIN